MLHDHLGWAYLSVHICPIVSTIVAPTYQLSKCLAGLVDLLLEHYPHHITNSKCFVDCIDSLRVCPTDLLSNIDVVSPFP